MFLTPPPPAAPAVGAVPPIPEPAADDRVAGWRLVHWSNEAMKATWLEEARGLYAASQDRHLSNIVEWSRINARSLGLILRLCERREDDRLRAYAVIAIGREDMDIGPIQRLLLRRRVYALKITGGVVTDDRSISPARSLGELLLFLRRLYKGLPIYLHAIPPAVLAELHAQPAYVRGMVVLPDGRMHHYRLDTPPTPAALMTILAGRTRANIRRHARRLEHRVGPGRIHLQSFSDPEDVNRFLAVALQIARQTYQYQQLNIGVAAHEQREQWLHDIAQAGWWRGHLLWCDEQAVAFLITVRVGDGEFGLEMGYDPLWAEWSVGTVALLELIRANIDAADPPAFLDFLYGDQDYKRRLSTDDWEEESEFLIPLSALGVMHAKTVHGGRQASRFIVRQLRRLGLKQIVKPSRHQT